MRTSVLKKAVLRTMISDLTEDFIAAGSKITMCSASTKKVKTFRNSSSVSNRGRKLVTLSTQGFARGRS
tara:strand:- start:363 stop:569 length:207 start_codon:yes stop_codon:yes gene_type:complete